MTVCYPECIARADRKELFECSVCDREFKHHSAVVLHEARHVTTTLVVEDGKKVTVERAILRKTGQVIVPFVVSMCNFRESIT